MGGIHLTPDSDEWRFVLNTGINYLFPYNAGNFFSTEEAIILSRSAVLHGVRVLK